MGRGDAVQEGAMRGPGRNRITPMFRKTTIAKLEVLGARRVLGRSQPFRKPRCQILEAKAKSQPIQHKDRQGAERRLRPGEAEQALSEAAPGRRPP